MERIIYTSAETSWRHWQATRPHMERYAVVCGARLVNLPKSSLPNPQWVIWDAMRDSIGRPGQSVWMDADIVVRHDAPNLFEAGFDDRFMVCEPSTPARIHPQWKSLWKNTGVPNPRPYPITGIISWNESHAIPLVEWMDASHHRFDKVLGDQELLAVALWECNLPFWFLPQDWHRMTKYVKPETPFKHAAGRHKPSRINRFIAQNEAPV